MKAVDLLIRSYVQSQPDHAARAFDGLDADDAAGVLAKLPIESAAAVLSRLAPLMAGAVLGRMELERTRSIIEALTPRQASAVIQHLEAGKREGLLAAMPESTGRLLRELLVYAPNSAGGMMDPQVTVIPIDLTAQAATALLRKARKETIYYLYAVDRDRKLAGVLNLRDLLLAAPRDPIAPLVRRDVVSVSATTPRGEIVDLMQHRGFIALPVVDIDGRLIGVVKPDEALSAAGIEAFGDLQKMVGAGEDERALEPVLTVVKRRLPWLYVNLLTAFLAATVVGVFEGTIAAFPALAILLPIVSGQGGNSGAQSLAVVMRGIALGEILPGLGKRVVLKEVLGAAINGLAVAVVTAAAIWMWSANRGFAFVIGLAMVVNMIAAGLAGAVIPLALKLLGRDPAQSSSIILTTVTDVVGFSAFLGFATLFRGWLG